jgi:hypothetical protein
VSCTPQFERFYRNDYLWSLTCCTRFKHLPKMVKKVYILQWISKMDWRRSRSVIPCCV